jgi:uncharacterized protein
MQRDASRFRSSLDDNNHNPRHQKRDPIAGCNPRREPLVDVGCLSLCSRNATLTGVERLFPSEVQLMTGSFELNQSANGQYRFVLKAGNGEVILTSEQYTTKASAQNGIASVQANSPNADRYERKDSSDGRFYFNLKAANHQVIGTSQLYKTAETRDQGIESVTANGATTTIKDHTSETK